MSIYAFDFRDQLYGPWEIARSALIDQLDLLYAGLNANTIGRDTNGHITTIGGVPITVDVTNISSGGTAANSWGTSTNGAAITNGIQQGVVPAVAAVQPVVVVTISLSATQINTLNSVPIAVIAGQPGKIIFPFGVVWKGLQGGAYNLARSAFLAYNTGNSATGICASFTVSLNSPGNYTSNIGIASNTPLTVASGDYGVGATVYLKGNADNSGGVGNSGSLTVCYTVI